MAQAALNDDQVKEILQGISIPPQPQIMVDLQMEQMNDPSVESIARLIAQDVGLSGSILKAVNSPFFGIPNKVTSIGQAINLLGVTATISIVNSISIRGSMSDERIVELTRFWDSATDIAGACAEISRQLKCASPDEAYTLGLFHNCGYILMLEKFDDFHQILTQSYDCLNGKVTDLENETFRTSHSIIGYYIGRAWNLPKYIYEAIGMHHSTTDIFVSGISTSLMERNLLAVLKIAEHLCGNHRILGNVEADHEWEQVGGAILEYLGISTYDLENLHGNLEDMGLTNNSFIDFSSI